MSTLPIHAPVSRAEADDVELSVVIPCLDEEETISFCVAAAREALDAAGVSGEVVVVDNGSRDASVALALAAGARVVPCPVRGYGAALQYGFEAARGRYVLMGDADGSYDFGELPRFLERLRGGARFVMGTRLHGRIQPGAMPVLHRYLGTPVLTRILNVLFGTRITDCNSGMRGFCRKTVVGLGLTSTGMELASELIVKAAIADVPIVEVPITLHKDRRSRRPHLRPWRDGWRHLRLLLWHAPEHTMVLPGLAALAVGLVLVFSQLRGPIEIGPVRFDIHYMILGLTFAMLGLSSTTLGLAVHAIMPEGTIKRSRLLRNAKEWFTFDRAVVVAGVLLVLGLACDGYVLYRWLITNRGPLTAEHTRISLFGIPFLAVGFEVLLAALLVGTARTATAPRIVVARDPEEVTSP